MGERRTRLIDMLQIFLDINVEGEYITILHAFEGVLRRWRRTEQELVTTREKLLRSQSELETLEVKLKHARNQVSVEMKRRQNAETEQEKLERQLQLVRDLLLSGEPGSASMMAVFGQLNRSSGPMGDEPSSSNISTLSTSGVSYDKTEDFMDQEVSEEKPERVKPREKRRSSLAPIISQPLPARRTRPGQLAASTPENVIESLILKTATMYTDFKNPTQSGAAVEALPRRRSRQSRPFSGLGQTSVWMSIEDETLPHIDETELEPGDLTQVIAPSEPPRKHVFVSKTVILAETCAACGKRTRFGKMSLKCRDCRLLIHPECQDACPKICAPGTVMIPVKIGQWSLADFAPTTAPRIPALVIQCVNEIELRGLKEKGIYRVPGCDRLVKDLKQKFLRGKGPLNLNRVDEIHAVCGLLKDFLRNLKEPLVTFYLHSRFLEAADILNEECSKAEMSQVVLKLPLANRDTLAYLILHLHRVIQSTYCNMDRNNLARVFGPTLVGHAIPEPSPLTIMQDTPRQAKVISRLLSLPSSFWNNILSNNQENIHPAAVESTVERCGKPAERVGRIFQPVTSPEINLQILSSASGLQRQGKRGLGAPLPNQLSSKNIMEPIKNQRFFTSPNAGC
ncbi:rac GTPase-activating protein 1-like isoform X2 [Lissotriton helveticus]